MALSVPEDERTEFIARECRGDETLAGEVRSLLGNFQEAEAQLEDPAFGDRTEPLVDDTVIVPEVQGYQFLNEVHRGGQGVVFKAIQESSGREVAVKLMLSGVFSGPAAKRRFRREVAIANALDHPGIVPVIDSGQTRGQEYFVMPFVDGETLTKAVREAKFSAGETISLFTEICDAVEHAHQQGIVHRDLKPSNILVDHQGNPHVLDFGVAKPIGLDWKETVTLSVTGQIMGTLAYMSPEQADGRGDLIDQRSDVYSLGVILYELLCGCLPYDVDGPLTEILHAIKQAKPNRKPLNNQNLSRSVMSTLLTALSKQREARFSSAGAFAEALREAAAVPVSKPSHLSATGRILTPKRIAVALMVTILTGFAVFFGAQFLAQPSTIAPPLKPDSLINRDLLQSQLQAMETIVASGSTPEQIVAELDARFGNIDGFQQGGRMEERPQKDLKLLNKLSSLLSTDPNAEELYGFSDQMLRKRRQHGPLTSGQVDELVDDILAIVIDAKTTSESSAESE